MLLPLKNELRLRLGPQQRGAEVWSGGLFTRLAGEALHVGRCAGPIEALVDTLEREGLALPRRASVCAEDEYVYYATLPALGSWKEANAAAGEYFAGMLGDADMLVDTTLAPCGSRWIAAAIDAPLVQGWREALEGRGVELRSVRPALLEDLWALRGHVELTDGVLALVRTEGASLIGLRDNAVVDVDWERCDVDDADVLADRIVSAGADLFDRPDAAAPPVCLVVSPGSDPRPLRDLAASRGWQFSEGLLRQAD